MGEIKSFLHIAAAVQDDSFAVNVTCDCMGWRNGRLFLIKESNFSA